MPDLRVLDVGEGPADPDNNIVLTEISRPGGVREYTLTITIDGKPLSTAGPFLNRDEAVDQALSEAAHYALDPIYLWRETP
jgi:hypothetical protein